VDVAIDGQKLEGVRPYLARGGNRPQLYLEKRGGKWAGVLPERLFTARLRRPEKVRNLQGPIDDAFMGAFLCVRGTGKPWHESTGRYAEAELARFRSEWSKYLRGELPVKDDVEVTAEDLATRHLVLFGDPSSNSLIEQALEGLPLRWTKKQITWGGKDYDASTHVPVLISWDAGPLPRHVGVGAQAGRRDRGEVMPALIEATTPSSCPVALACRTSFDL
jgi:hypothetical protein